MCTARKSFLSEFGDSFTQKSFLRQSCITPFCRLHSFAAAFHAILINNGCEMSPLPSRLRVYEDRYCQGMRTLCLLHFSNVVRIFDTCCGITVDRCIIKQFDCSRNVGVGTQYLKYLGKFFAYLITTKMRCCRSEYYFACQNSFILQWAIPADLLGCACLDQSRMHICLARGKDGRTSLAGLQKCVL